jgi:hypothetical protein
MQQKSDDHKWPLGFFSRKLTDMESHFSTFDRELLAAFAAIRHFRHFCDGRSFQLWTDHKSLVTTLSRVSIPISPRQQRHLAFISEFTVQVLYLPGLKNVVANFLSRSAGLPALLRQESEQDSRDRTAWKGQLGQDIQKRRARPGKPQNGKGEQDRQKMACRTGLPGPDCQDRTTRTVLQNRTPVHDGWERTAKAEQSEQFLLQYSSNFSPFSSLAKFKGQ